MIFPIAELEKLVGEEWLEVLRTSLLNQYIEQFKVNGDHVTVKTSDKAEIRFMFEQFSTSNEEVPRKKPWST
jgi:hypothetical protein